MLRHFATIVKNFIAVFYRSIVLAIKDNVPPIIRLKCPLPDLQLLLVINMENELNVSQRGRRVLIELPLIEESKESEGSLYEAALHWEKS